MDFFLFKISLQLNFYKNFFVREVQIVVILKMEVQSFLSYLHFGSISTRIPKQKIQELGSLSKSEKVRLNRLYSRGRAAYGSIQNLSKASGLSKKKVERFYKPRHRIQNLVHQSGLSEEFKRFLNISMKSGVWTWLL